MLLMLHLSMVGNTIGPIYYEIHVMYFRCYFYVSSLSSHWKLFFRSLATPLTVSRSSGAPANVRNMFVIDHATFLSLVKIASFSCHWLILML